jgi:nucleotide-binding universal stress UspA family protein
MMVRTAQPKAREEARRPRLIRRILLAVDDSPQAEDAIDLVIPLAKVAAAEVVVAHVRVHTHIHGVRVSLEAGETSQAVLDSALQRLKRARVKARIRQAASVAGEEARVIGEIADEIDADLIVVGSRGLSLVRAILEGSVAYDLIHRRHRPVLTVP